MKAEPLRKLNIYMRPKQKAALQLVAANAGMSVSAWGRSMVHTALAEAPPATHQTAHAPEKPPLQGKLRIK